VSTSSQIEYALASAGLSRVWRLSPIFLDLDESLDNGLYVHYNLSHTIVSLVERERVIMPKQQSDLLTVHEIAQELRVDETTVRRWIKNGALEAVALPHQGLRQAYRIKKSTLDALLAGTAATQ